MAALPTGTVTFLFTDVEGSTALLQRFGDRRYAEVLADHQRLLRAAFAKGHGQEVDTQGDAFLVAFSRARDAVATAVAARDLGTHRLKDLREPEHLLQVVHPDLPADFPPVKSLDVLPNNLPRQLTSFIGREKEMADVKRLLSTAYLVTLTGSGGAGKTRLALQVAADLVEGYPDGVWFAEFAPIADPALVPKTVASALNVPEQPDRDMIETLVDALRPKALLLVLDNCEHLLVACADLAAALLRACPQVRILATSREGLAVPGETIWRIPSLSLPDVRHLPPFEDLVLYEAVRLFVDRAVATAPGFTVTSENAPAVRQVCQQLDGIPLAIELAAARVKVLAVEQIAARLDDRFRLLTGGSRMILPRHQTLRAAMDWSHDLLSQKERAVLRRLAVFTGGCTLEAAETVCARKRVKADEILDLLTQLVDKSLVSAETMGGEVRYWMPETIRQYAQDRLLTSGESAEVRTRHRAWYLDLAERAEVRMRGPEQTMWLNRLEVEHDNLRAALGWSTTQEDDAEIKLRLAGALGWLWNDHTHWNEGRKWLEIALAGAREIKSTARVKALHRAALMVWRQRDDEVASALLEDSLALARELGDQKGIAQALFGRALVAMRQGNLEAAGALFEENLEALRNLEDRWSTATTLSQMGIVARRRGDYAKSVALSEESLAMRRTLGGKTAIAYSLRLTGHAVRLQGDLERAAALYRESLALFGETGDKWGATECLDGLALIASMRGNSGQAAHLFGAVEAARERFGITVGRPERGAKEQPAVARVEEQKNTILSAAWAEGRAMTLEHAVEYALIAGESR